MRLCIYRFELSDRTFEEREAFFAHKPIGSTRWFFKSLTNSGNELNLDSDEGWRFSKSEAIEHVINEQRETILSYNEQITRAKQIVKDAEAVAKDLVAIAAKTKD